MEEMRNPILCFSTFNQLDMTRKCLEYAQELGYDILVIDDASTDGTQDYLSQIKCEAMLKSKRKGLTDSWNMAYKHWKMSKEYSHLVLCNNDVLIPKGSVEGLMSDHALTVPMCNESGAGYVCKEQAKYPFQVPDGTVDPEWEGNISLVQNHISIANNFYRVKCWTGFCMCMSREIITYELPDGNLFDPKNVNVGNDDDLASRVQAYIALGSFVYHFKGMSFNKTIGGRNDLSRTY